MQFRLLCSPQTFTNSGAPPAALEEPMQLVFLLNPEVHQQCYLYKLYVCFGQHYLATWSTRTGSPEKNTLESQTSSPPALSFYYYYIFIAKGQDLNPGLLLCGQRLCKWGAHFTNWANGCPPPSSPNHNNLTASLHWSREYIPINIRVDSCTDDSFVDLAIVEWANFPVETLDFPKPVNTPGGRFLAHCTVHITVVISGNQRAQIKFFGHPFSLFTCLLWTHLAQLSQPHTGLDYILHF